MLFPRPLGEALRQETFSLSTVFTLANTYQFWLFEATEPSLHFFNNSLISRWQQIEKQGLLRSPGIRKKFNALIAEETLDAFFVVYDFLQAGNFFSGHKARENFYDFIQNAAILIDPQILASWDRMANGLSQEAWEDCIRICRQYPTATNVGRDALVEFIQAALLPDNLAYNADMHEPGTYAEAAQSYNARFFGQPYRVMPDIDNNPNQAAQP